MSILTEFKKRVPNFPEQYKISLFDNISKTGGGSAETKSNLGKHFENNYELYCYSFRLGIKAEKRIKFSPGDRKVISATQLNFGVGSLIQNEKILIGFRMLCSFIVLIELI